MRSLPWQKIILSILFLTILIGLSSCQSDSKVVKDLKNTIDDFTAKRYLGIHKNGNR